MATWPGCLGSGPSLGPDPSKVYERLVGRRKHLKELSKFLKEFKAEKAAGWSMKKIGVKIGKDVVLELVKDFADKYAENAAAITLQRASEQYLGADVAARTLFAVYQATVKAQDAAEEAQVQLLNEKARLIAKWDPDTKQTVHAHEPFARDSELRIRLAIRGADPSTGSGRFPLKVFVAGVEAKRGPGTYEYVIAGSALPGDADRLLVEVR